MPLGFPGHLDILEGHEDRFFHDAQFQRVRWQLIIDVAWEDGQVPL